MVVLSCWHNVYGLCLTVNSRHFLNSAPSLPTVQLCWDFVKLRPLLTFPHALPSGNCKSLSDSSSAGLEVQCVEMLWLVSDSYLWVILLLTVFSLPVLYFSLSVLGCLASSSKLLSHRHYSGETVCCFVLSCFHQQTGPTLHIPWLDGTASSWTTQGREVSPRWGRHASCEPFHKSESSTASPLCPAQSSRANVSGFHRCPLECHCHSVRQVVFLLSDAVIVYFFPPSLGGHHLAPK